MISIQWTYFFSAYTILSFIQFHIVLATKWQFDFIPHCGWQFWQDHFLENCFEFGILVQIYGYVAWGIQYQKPMTYHSHIINPQGPSTVNKEKQVIMYISLSGLYRYIKAQWYLWLMKAIPRKPLFRKKIIYDIEV